MSSFLHRLSGKRASIVDDDDDSDDNDFIVVENEADETSSGYSLQFINLILDNSPKFKDFSRGKINNLIQKLRNTVDKEERCEVKKGALCT
eukprot:TRINITY_DN5507_c0_g1_i1.p2 TRINITY_DN5507_c0_g1~~TRINITY_DN5507_c0_g1_i1.p2  ORF type:complete len:91 (-),score=14.47 TRINITY_DN5507_c0_g1_i1:1364-1636(-)